VNTADDVIGGRALWAVEQGDALALLRALPDGVAQACVTSPPYFGLRSYLPNGHADKSLEVGLEETPAAYCARLVEVFREVRRVLHPSGCLWLNLGDSYAGGGGGNYTKGNRNNSGQNVTNVRNRPGWLDNAGVKAKDLIGVPWMTAFALRQDGWWLRQALPWVKRGAMPESVTDRPANAIEYVFLLAKGPRPFFDMEAVKRGVSSHSDFGRERPEAPMPSSEGRLNKRTAAWLGNGSVGDPAGRNFRNADLWFESLAPPHGLCGVDDELVGLDVISEPLKDAHFAVMPTGLVRPLLLAGTSERGVCPKCSAPWRRVVARERKPTRPGRESKVYNPKDQAKLDSGDWHAGKSDGLHQPGWRQAAVGNRDPERHCTETRTLGWEPGCACDEAAPVPGLVLDPFCGSGTVGVVARRLGRRFVGFDLSADYVSLSRKRVGGASPLFDWTPPLDAPAE
jgi:hypothetical protein